MLNVKANKLIFTFTYTNGGGLHHNEPGVSVCFGSLPVKSYIGPSVCMVKYLRSVRQCLFFP